jgi:ABC-type uncharacterized transport system substrate-binding protein
MNRKRKALVVGVVALVIIALVVGGYYTFRSPWEYRGDGPIKIFYLNSYHDYPWTLDQIEGFRRVFDIEGVDIDVRQFNMDTKQRSSDEWEEIAREVRNEIEEWGPDLIYATDDNAQRYVGEYLAGGEIPWIFSGVNAEDGEYYSEEDKNVAGVFERYPVEAAISLIRSLLPYAKNIAVISDNSPSGVNGIKWIRSQENKIPDMQFISYDLVDTFEEFKTKVMEYQVTADLIMFRGLDTLEDENGEVLSQKEVTKWFVKNSYISEVSFWDYFVEYGALASVTVSGLEQGEAAGVLAKKILIDGKTPSKMNRIVPSRGDTHINTARADSLDLKISSIVLVNSIVHEEFPWEGEG